MFGVSLLTILYSDLDGENNISLVTDLAIDPRRTHSSGPGQPSLLRLDFNMSVIPCPFENRLAQLGSFEGLRDLIAIAPIRFGLRLPSLARGCWKHVKRVTLMYHIGDIRLSISSFLCVFPVLVSRSITQLQIRPTRYWYGKRV